ncbi:unnamed protein product [Sphagnum tenellum]
MNAAFTAYDEARRLQGLAISGSNETPVKAWAAVCRQCAIANERFRNSLKDQLSYTRFELGFLNNLERIWGTARAQLAHHQGKAA